MISNNRLIPITLVSIAAATVAMLGMLIPYYFKSVADHTFAPELVITAIIGFSFANFYVSREQSKISYSLMLTLWFLYSVTWVIAMSLFCGIVLLPLVWYVAMSIAITVAVVELRKVNLKSFFKGRS